MPLNICNIVNNQRSISPICNNFTCFKSVQEGAKNMNKKFKKDILTDNKYMKMNSP